MQAVFTGIIEEVGRLSGVELLGDARQLRIEARLSAALSIGQSVAVSGVCQTVVEKNNSEFAVVAVEETLRKTTLGALMAGSPVNLERALRLSDRLDGHLVQGHVDQAGTVTSVHEEGANRLVRVAYDDRFRRFVIGAGSIAIDGISLTVAHLDDSELTVAVIPHTYAYTNCATWQAETLVNLEFDLIGKYVARQVDLSSTRC